MKSALKQPFSLLLLDDSSDLVRVYTRQLESVGLFLVTGETDGNRARLLAEKQLFDFLVIDAKIDYKGFEFGGMRLADELRPRYGAGSIVIISRFITAAFVRDYGASYEFMEKYSGVNEKSFCADLGGKLLCMAEKQFVFVAMPFAHKYDLLYSKYLKIAIQTAGFKCVRIDEVSHTRPIQEVIFQHVHSSKLVLFVADGRNPNAFYEAGFADAMKKEVIIVTKKFDDLPFDISNRHSIAYRDSATILLSAIPSKIRDLRLAGPLAL